MNQLKNSFLEIERVFKSQTVTYQQNLAQKDENLKKFMEIQERKETEIEELRKEMQRILEINESLQRKLNAQQSTIKQLDEFKRSMYSLIQSTPVLNESTTTLVDLSDKDLRFLENSQKSSNSTLHSQPLVQVDQQKDSVRQTSNFSQSTGTNFINAQRQQNFGQSLGSSQKLTQSARSTPKKQPLTPPQVHNDLVPEAMSYYNNSLEKIEDLGEQSFLHEPSLAVFENSETQDVEFSCSSMDPSGLLTIELLEPPLKPESIDPANLYRLIRQCITAEEFEEFAKVIGNFNRGSDPKKTIEDVKRLVPDQNLVNQMTRLVLNAVG